MPIKLPRLTWALDCEPLGYPGLVVTFWLNPPRMEDEDLEPKVKKSGAWDTAFYRSLAIVVDEVQIPAEYTVAGRSEVVEVPDAKALYELERGEGFDPQILLWAANRYQEQRLERLRAESKN